MGQEGSKLHHKLFSDSELEILQRSFRESFLGGVNTDRFSKSEFRTRFSKAGLAVDESFVEHIFSLFDVNHDEVIDAKEFLNVLGVFIRGKNSNRFTMFDEDCDGLITTEELKSHYQKAFSVNFHDIPPTEHFGYSCNHCEEPITGSRFRCCECKWVDLCAACQKQGAEVDFHLKTHTMNEITVPLELEAAIADQIESSFRLADLNCDGAISPEEFYHWASLSKELKRMAESIEFEARGFGACILQSTSSSTSTSTTSTATSPSKTTTTTTGSP